MNARANAPRRRRGCLGCGCLGCLGQLIALVLVGCVLVAATLAVFFPWAYFLGGRFHLLPGWSGVGTAHARSGDFRIYVNLQPSGPGRYAGPRVSGTCVVIDPRGEKFVLKTTGAYPVKWWGTDSNGRRMALQFHRRIVLQNTDGRPRFELDGSWRNPNLVTTDLGSLSRAFGPDGRAYLGATRLPAASETLDVVLAPCGMLDSFRALYGLGKP